MSELSINPEKDLRCFIGIFFDDKTLLKIEKTVLPLKKLFYANQIRWIPLNQIHITLRFLGRTTPLQVITLQKELNNLAKMIPDFSISLQEIVYFPSQRRPRLLALMTDYPEPFAFLISKIETLVTTLGFPQETRPFLSHISLARFKKFRIFSMSHVITLNHTIMVREFHLMKSETLPKGPCYTPIARFKLSPISENG